MLYINLWLINVLCNTWLIQAGGADYNMLTGFIDCD